MMQLLLALNCKQQFAKFLLINIVKIQLQTINESFKPLNFKVVDTKEGKPIAKDTDENALKARFKPEAL